MVKNADGQRGDRSARTPGAGAARLQQAGPAADIQAERRRLRVRFEMEAAVLHEGWQRLLPAAGPVGCDAQDLARLSRPADTDWWVKFYPGGNMQRPTGPLCDGCHSVNYNAQTKTVSEWNVGCERCHGPGSEHLRQRRTETIVNPARL